MSNLNSSIKFSYPAIAFPENLPELHEAMIAVKMLFPDEIMPLGELGVSQSVQKSTKTLRGTLENAFRFGSDTEVQRAELVSRTLGTLVARHLGTTIESNAPFRFGHGTLGFDGVMIGIDEPKHIIDHGVGLNGLLSHREHINKDGHLVVVSAEDDIQACGLDGVAKGLLYPDDSVLALVDAIEASEVALEEFGEKSFDLALLSRIHMMSRKAMKVVLETTPRLLKEGGVVVVRSPQHYSRGTNAEQQVSGLLDSGIMTLDASYSFPNSGIQNGDPNPQQAFVLRRAA